MFIFIGYLIGNKVVYDRDRDVVYDRDLTRLEVYYALECAEEVQEIGF